MLPSGNDAAFALAQHFGELIYNKKLTREEANRVYSYKFNWHQYFVKYFLAEMNKNAAKLAMYSTNYDSPHGLMNKWNYSTAHDVGKLACQLMKNEEIRKIVNTKVYEC